MRILFNESPQLSTPGLKRKLTNENLGHIFRRRIERLVSDEILDSLDFTNLNICINCINQKQTSKRRFEGNRTLDALELIHTNICGLFLAAAWKNQQYFMTFINNFSRYSYKYLLHEKSQSLDMLKNVKAKVEN